MNPSSSPAVDAGTSPYTRLKALGIVLPPAPRPIANFVTHIQEGNMLYLSGQGPREDDGFMHTGKVGETVSVEDAYAHARLTGINLLAVLHSALGDLGRVKQVVKLLGMVNAVPDFADRSSRGLSRPTSSLMEPCPAGGQKSLSVSFSSRSLPCNAYWCSCH